jgi:hypothetical protein
MYIKDWFKAIFPLFLTWLRRKLKFQIRRSIRTPRTVATLRHTYVRHKYFKLPVRFTVCVPAIISKLSVCLLHPIYFRYCTNRRTDLSSHTEDCQTAKITSINCLNEDVPSQWVCPDAGHSDTSTSAVHVAVLKTVVWRDKQDQPLNWTSVNPSNKNNGTLSRTLLAKLPELNRVPALLHCVMSAAFCPRAQRNYYCLRPTGTALTLNSVRLPLSSGKPWAQNIHIISKTFIMWLSHIIC